MLRHLYIRNFTLIDLLDIEFQSGFSVITGETGAGKSIILGAIGLLLGQRADLKSIKQGANKCVIEAHFDLSRYTMKPFFEQNDIEYDATDCIIRRELTASGKSRAFINDTPVALNILKELGEQLVDVHSQHQNLLLSKQDFQLSVIDILADNANAIGSYTSAFAAMQATGQQLEKLQAEIARNRENADFLRFQYEELTNARLTEGEQEEWEQKSATMSHAEDIKSALYEAQIRLSENDAAAITQVKSALNALQSISHILPATAELTNRLNTCHIELKDIAVDVNRQLETIDFDPSELDAINTRLDRIYELEKKYHVTTVEELLGRQEELKQQLNNIDNSDEAVADLQQKLDAQRQQCNLLADKLTAKRQQAAKTIERQMQERLMPLGMPNVRFSVSIKKTELSRNGQDQVAFLFSANTSTPPQPIAQVASGGEIARVMLSLKAMISGAVKLPTIIFDEIDTGVSGKMAERMAEIMQEMGRNERQVISITHLPQIAALGTTHYRVTKEESSDGTISRMQQLTPDERITEIAQMLSGSDVTAAAINNAKELLKL